MAKKGENIEENKEEKEEEIEENFDYLDLSIDLRKRPDLRKKMTPEMKIERRRKSQNYRISTNKSKNTKISEKTYIERLQNINNKLNEIEPEFQEVKSTKQTEENFDHLDLSINLRLRSDLKAKMTPEMWDERRKKQREISQRKTYLKNADLYKKLSKERYHKLKDAITSIEKRFDNI